MAEKEKKITYRDMAWLGVGLLLGITVSFIIVYGYTILILKGLNNINIEQITFTVNETKMVDYALKLAEQNIG